MKLLGRLRKLTPLIIERLNQSEMVFFVSVFLAQLLVMNARVEKHVGEKQCQYKCLQH